jgi:hypothetical protein
MLMAEMSAAVSVNFDLETEAEGERPVIRKIRPLTLRMTNELQMIQSGMELGDYETSLRSCSRAEIIIVQLRTEILLVIQERQQDEVKRRNEEIEAIQEKQEEDIKRGKEEIEAIKAMMPRKGGARTLESRST